MVGLFSKIRKKFSRFRLLISDFKPILLSHHPNCDHFSSHVYHIGKKKLCIGCFTLYPFIIITIILTILLVELNTYNLVMLYLLSFVLFAPIILNFIGLTKYKLLKIFSKAFNGIGVGFHLVSVFFLPLPIIIKILVLVEINFIIGVIAYIRSKHIKKECLKCEYEGNWDNCPAWKPIRDKLYEHGFRKRNKDKF